MIDEREITDFVANDADILFATFNHYEKDPNVETGTTLKKWLSTTVDKITSLCNNNPTSVIPHTNGGIDTNENYMKTLRGDLQAKNLLHQANDVLNLCSYMYFNEMGMTSTVQMLCGSDDDPFDLAESYLQQKFSGGVGKVLNMITIKLDRPDGANRYVATYAIFGNSEMADAPLRIFRNTILPNLRGQN